jgi:ubiquinone biosynthesis protein UbiJ
MNITIQAVVAFAALFVLVGGGLIVGILRVLTQSSATRAHVDAVNKKLGDFIVAHNEICPVRNGSIAGLTNKVDDVRIAVAKLEARLETVADVRVSVAKLETRIGAILTERKKIREGD